MTLPKMIDRSDPGRMGDRPLDRESESSLCKQPRWELQAAVLSVSVLEETWFS